MGISGSLVGLSSLMGIGGSLAGMFGNSGANSIQLPSNPSLPYLPQAGANAYQGIQGLSPYTNLASSTVPYGQQTFQNLYNNPYAGAAQGGANFASGLGQNAALGAYGTGGAFTGAGLGTIPYAQQLMSSGFDPQQALYSRTLQQVQDQSRAANEAAGVGTTPYGAGLENQATSNFNIDWQNNLLNRQLQAAGGAGSLLGQGANLAGFGTGLQSQAPGQFAQSSAMPYSTFTGIGQGQNQAINSLLGIGSQGQGIAQTPIQDYMSYLNSGNQQANQIAGLGLQQNQMGFNQNQQLGAGLGQNLYGLGRILGAPAVGGGPAAGWGQTSNPWGQYFGGNPGLY